MALISNLCGSINPQTWRGVENLPLYGKMELQQNLNRRVVERLEVYVRVRFKFIVLGIVIKFGFEVLLGMFQIIDFMKQWSF